MQIEQLVAEVNVYSLASHMFWGAWALLQVGGCARAQGRFPLPHLRRGRRPAATPAQARWSSIDFDYLAYARLRWHEARHRQAEFLGAAAVAFPSAAHSPA